MVDVCALEMIIFNASFDFPGRRTTVSCRSFQNVAIFFSQIHQVPRDVCSVRAERKDGAPRCDSKGYTSRRWVGTFISVQSGHMTGTFERGDVGVEATATEYRNTYPEFPHPEERRGLSL